MSKRVAFLTLVLFVVTFITSSIAVNVELGAFVPSLSFLTDGAVGDAVGSLLATLLGSFLGLDSSIAGPLVDVLLML